METTGTERRLVIAAIAVAFGAILTPSGRAQDVPSTIDGKEAVDGALRCGFLSDDLLAGCAYSCLYVWDCRTSRRMAHQCGGRFEAVVHSPDGRYLVFGRKVFEAPKLHLVKQLPLADDDPPIVESAAFSRDGNLLAFGLNHGRIIVVETKTWSVVHRLTGPNRMLIGIWVAFGQTSNQLLAGWGVHQTNTAVTLHDLEKGSTQELTRATRGNRRHVGEPFSQVVKTACGDLFLVGDTPQFAISPSHKSFVLAALTDDSHAALGVWDSRTLQPKWIADLGLGKMMGVAYSPDERFILVGGYATHDRLHQTEIPLRILNAESGELVLTLPRSQTTATTGIAFSPDGKTVALSRLNAPIELLSWKSIEEKLR